jgi:hypothetical protein
MRKESWERLARAQKYYESFGFRYVDVPWAITEEVADITTPAECSYVYYNDAVMVGSAEQSFLQIWTALDSASMYYAITPCFRDEEELTKITRPYFMKLELFSKNIHLLPFIRAAAMAFFQNECGYTNKKNVNTVLLDITPEGHETRDINYKNIELGSYGYRKHEDMEWVYGTGLAEPRFSVALDK